MQLLDPAYVHSSLRRLISQEAKIIGANGHDFRLNPRLLDSKLQQFEESHAVKLPVDYAHFLTRIGNGGAGPDYGVFPLGLMDGTSSDLEPWRENEGMIGKLSEPFLLNDAWNDLTLQPTDELLEKDQKEYDRLIEEFDKVYWNQARMNGAIPICHMGCALRIWLIVTGEQAGHLWRDGRAEFVGLSPLLLQDGSRASFSSWYQEWLGHSLLAAQLSRSTLPH